MSLNKIKIVSTYFYTERWITKAINRDLWNKWTELHVKSAFYKMEVFKKGETSLQSIELDLLKEVEGKKLLHLQCHFGQDTLSIARLGATVTGVDIAENAIQAANDLASDLGIDAQL